MKIDMIMATRLTQEGRLKEAMAVLSGAHRVPSPSNSASNALQDHPARGPSTIDMLPPSSASKGSWMAAPFDEGHPGGLRQQQLPETLRALLDRLGQFNVADGLGASAGLVFPVPDGARFEERTYANGEGSRHYKLFIPSGYVGQEVPLLLMLHGCKQSPDDFAAGTRMNELAEVQTFLVAYPAQTQSANISKCWNWFNEGHQQRDQGEPSLIAGITRQIMSDFTIDPRQVSIAGLSAGGAAAAIMGASYPDLFDSVGVHSGLACGAAADMPSAFAAMRTGARTDLGRRSTVRTIVFHGDRDMTVNSVNGDQVVAQSNATTGLRISVSQGESPGGARYSRTVHSNESGDGVIEQWVVHGLGHAWSGGSSAGSYTDAHGPDASREMVRFSFEVGETELRARGVHAGRNESLARN